jgi:hypothetical protein
MYSPPPPRREKTRRWETLLRSLFTGQTSYLLGLNLRLNGPHPLDSYRVETQNRLRVNQTLILVLYNDSIFLYWGKSNFFYFQLELKCVWWSHFFSTFCRFSRNWRGDKLEIPIDSGMVVETCVSFMDFDLVRMVRSVKTKRMRGTKEDDWKNSNTNSQSIDDHLFILKHVLMNDETPGRHAVILSTCKILLVEDLHFLWLWTTCPVQIMLNRQKFDVIGFSSYPSPYEHPWCGVCITYVFFFHDISPQHFGLCTLSIFQVLTSSPTWHWLRIFYTNIVSITVNFESYRRSHTLLRKRLLRQQYWICVRQLHILLYPCAIFFCDT